jgi:hypothetical protein
MPNPITADWDTIYANDPEARRRHRPLKPRHVKLKDRGLGSNPKKKPHRKTGPLTHDRSNRCKCRVCGRQIRMEILYFSGGRLVAVNPDGTRHGCDEPPCEIPLHLQPTGENDED